MLKFFIRLFWASFLFLMLPWTMQGQSFPYVVSVQTVQGLCYDDSHIIVTLTDNSGHVVQIDPETHNAVDMNSYPLSNVQYYYQNVTAGTTLQYSYSNDIVVPAGTYLVGVVVNIPGANGVWTNVDVPYGNVAVTTQYNHLEAMVLDLANANYLGHERCGMHPSLSCVACGRIQLKLVNGRFPYHVVILDEQNDTVRDVTYSQRVQSGSNASYADFRDYYTFDSMAVGNYTIFISDACNYSVRLSAIIPDVSPWGYEFYFNPNKKCEESDNILFFAFSVRNSGTTGSLKNYMHPYLSNTMQYCFVHSGQDTTAWRQMQFNDSYDGGGWIYIYDTLESGLRVCEIMDDTLQFLIKDMCLDSVFVTKWHIVSGFFLKDSMRIVPYNGIETPDTCSIHVSNGISTQSYLFYGNINNSSGWNVSYSDRVITVASRYYGCPLFFNAWSLPDSTLLAHGESNDFNGFGVPISIAADTTLSVHIAISDVHDCVLAEFDTTLTFQTSQAEDIDYWWECGHYDTPNNWFVCCENRYMWLQEHLVEADSFRRNMTLHLIESPLYNRFNFTAVRQDGVWTVNNDDPNNTSTSVEFSYEDGWRATIRDAECLSPGRYVFEIHNDCGDTIISYQWNGYYTDSTFLVSTPQYNAYQVCDQFVIPTNDVSIVRNYYHIYPDIDNNVPQIQTSQPRYYFTVRGHSNNVFFYVESYEPYIILSQPGVYSIDLTTNAGSDCSRLFYSDTVSFTQTFLKFDFANAYICDVSSSTGMVLAQAINGNKPYTFNLYDQWNANGNVIATSDTGFFNNVPMMAGQHLSVLVTDSCNNSFSVNLTASALTQENLIMSVGDSIHCEGDTLHLEAKQFPFPTSYQWTGPNGFSDTSRVIDVHIPYGSESGWYRVDITNSLCGNTLSDSIYITVTPAPRVTILGDTIVCPDRQIILDFIPHGTGTVNFDILHSDNNLRTHYSVAAGDTVQQSLQILSNIVFWADSIFDEACAYHSFIDSFPVLMRVLDYNPTHVYDTVLENNLPFGIYDTVFQNAGTYEITLSDQFGCDSAVFVHLTVLYNVTAVDDSVVCFSALPLTWNNTVFRADMMDTLAGSSVPIITHPGVLTASNGVDSTVTMTLYVNPAYSLADTATVCADELPYIWNGVTFTEAGTQYVTLPTIDGCDSIIAMTLVVKPLYAVTDTAVICADELPYTWNGVTFMEAGTQSATLPTVYGCDSVVAMTLLVNPTYSVTDTAVICADELPLTWNGVTFTEAGTQSATLPTVDGCDSVVAMTLLVNPTYSVTDTAVICADELPHIWNGVTFTEAGTWSLTLQSVNGCDSVVAMTLVVNPAYSVTDTAVVCADELPHTWNGVTFTEAGTHSTTLQSVSGCDSIIAMTLVVKPLYAVTDTAVICADELPYTWNGVTFMEAGTQSATLPTVYGCDSVVAMTLLVNPTYSVTDTAVICANELPLTWNGVTFTGAGTRSATLPTVDGCDSVVAMTLVVLPMPEFYDTLHLVQNQMPYHFLPNDTILTLSSTFIQFQYSHPAEGCDSIFHQTVFVHLNTTQQVDTVVCAASLPTSWHGHLFTGNASFTDTLQTVFQSDSVVTYSLTVTNISADIGNIVQVVCFGDSTGSASATFSGGNAPLTLRWTNAANTPVSSTDSLGGQPAGFYTFTVTDNLGCSASDTVTLRNLHATMAPGAVSEDQDLCEGNTPDPFLGTPASGGADGHYLWQINLNGTDWVAAPGTNNAQNYTYPDSVTGSFSLRRAWISAACGTVFSNTVTINVWMNHHDTVEANVCQDEPFQDFGFDIGADETDEVGLQTFTQLLPSSHCDSTLTLLLTVNPKYEALIEENVCEGDGYFLNGFSVNHQETMGVDELTRELTLQSASGCDSIVRLHLSVIDTSLHIESSTDDFCERLSAELMAVTEMTDYLWNTGETSQEITVTQPGLYRVTAYQGQCNRTASYHVETCHTDLHLPNSITPVHSSGLNDYFSIPEMFQQSIRRFEIRIYDRWGELVFHSTDKNFKWRGECKGQIQHNSIFNYIILFTDKMGNHQVKGSLLVL